MPVRIACADIILDIFRLSCQGIIHVAVHDLMQLEDIIFRDRNGIEAFVDDIQDVTVAGDLLFITVLRSGPLLHKLPDTRIGSNNALNRVGSLGALNLRDLHQLFKLLGPLLQVLLLLSGFPVDGRDISKYVRIPFLVFDQ